MNPNLAHVLIALALIGAYVAVTITGHDGNQLLVILGGYAGGAAVASTASSSTTKPL